MSCDEGRRKAGTTHVGIHTENSWRFRTTVRWSRRGSDDGRRDMLPVSKKTLEAVQTALDSVEFPLDGKLWRPTGYQLHALRYLGTGEQEAMVVPGGQSTLRSLADKGLVDNRNTVRWSGGEITLYRLTRRGRKFLKRASLALKLKNIMNTVTGV